MRTISTATLTAFLALWIGLECGYRIGYQSALKTQARAIKQASEMWEFKIKQAYKVSKITGTPFYQVLTGQKQPEARRYGGLDNGY